MQTFYRLLLASVCAILISACVGWRPGIPDTMSNNMKDKVIATVADFKAREPGLERYFQNAYGYAVYPSIGKGGLIFGGAHGDGEVYAQGQLIGNSSLTQVTFGLQIGGQAYSEIIFFHDKKALEYFTSGSFTSNAQVSAAAVVGAALNADYSNGVAIFTLVNGGLMAEATVGVQSFSFTPLK